MSMGIPIKIRFPVFLIEKKPALGGLQKTLMLFKRAAVPSQNRSTGTSWRRP